MAETQRTQTKALQGAPNPATEVHLPAAKLDCPQYHQLHSLAMDTGHSPTTSPTVQEDEGPTPATPPAPAPAPSPPPHVKPEFLSLFLLAFEVPDETAADGGEQPAR